MRYLSIILLIVTSCSTHQKSLENQKSPAPCPENGICTFDVIKDKAYEIKKDEFGNSYLDIFDGKKIVLKFKYKRNEISETADSNYEEVIYAQLDQEEIELVLNNEELKNVNLSFGRLCFCKGQTGYYSIDRGSLSVKKSRC
ncbi:hypothetical protein [Sediminibacter sp. Hel_I_10]|uniref:hypothetical protein n=1 Tax=Sediminibacter sp. Hel_I_10 TaxID=1392490 RepID=UPI00047B5CB2|nr:hypothetical protein [Sediminibacter sp. Hel_I_10]